VKNMCLTELLLTSFAILPG